MFVPSRHKPWLDALARCARVLDDLGVPYCLDGGTLIGLARDGTFVQHDKDLDLTLFEQQDRLQELARALKAAGFSSSVVRSLHHPVGTQKLVPAIKDARIDIVNKRDQGGMAAWVIYGNRAKVKTMPAAFYTDLGTLDVEGFAFKVPRELTAYLTHRWGREWRTPILGPMYKRYTMDRAYPEARNERRSG